VSHCSSSLNYQELNGYIVEPSSIQNSPQVQNLRNLLTSSDMKLIVFILVAQLILLEIQLHQRKGLIMNLVSHPL
jgi:hypothetical protein